MELDNYDYFELTFFDATNQIFNTTVFLASPKGHNAKLAVMI